MDKHDDEDWPMVDGIPIPPYEPSSKVQYPLTVTDKDMRNGLIFAVALPFICAILFALFVIAGRLGLW